MTATNQLFDEVERLPDTRAHERYAALVGLDEHKRRLLKESALLLDRDALARWSREHHGREVAAVDAFRERRPLFVFAGDVGAGKTELAETFGGALAEEQKLDVILFRLSLSARGTGAVGEMTTLISAAFDHVQSEIPIPRGKPRVAGVLVIDEADALAQSRALTQMHHEDRAGVNALIRKIDGISADRRPVITVLCTNRLEALDPAIRRRAAAELEFERPNAEQRRAVLEAALDGSDISDAELARLVELTGPIDGRPYGYTYSDLRMRVVPGAVLAAYPDQPLSFELVAAEIEASGPTAPFAP
jgi:AAA+ superfamily predicted ATPase